MKAIPFVLRDHREQIWRRWAETIGDEVAADYREIIGSPLGEKVVRTFVDDLCACSEAQEYEAPTVASLAGYGNWDSFAVDAGDGYVSFVEIGKALGGSALGVALLASALLGNLALYLDYLASGARPLFAIAADGLFPRSIARVSGRFGTPIAAILLMAALNAVLIVGPFQNLVVIDVILFISAYVLIFVSAVRLRVTEPDLKRPFRVPLGTKGMIAMVIPPILIVALTIYLNAIDRSTELFGITGFKLLGQDVGWYGIAGFAALFSGPVLYYGLPGHLWWAEHAGARGRRRGDRHRRGRGSRGRRLMQTHIQVLSEDEKAQVHERTLKVLSTVGMRCDTGEGRRILAAPAPRSTTPRAWSASRRSWSRAC